MSSTDKEMKLIAERMQALRKSLGYSYQQLADETGMSKSTLQRYESGGIKNIPLSRTKSLARALKTTPEYLMGWGTEEAKKSPPSGATDSGLTKEERHLMELLSKLTPENLDLALAQIDLLLKRQEKK